jgi:D-alanine-D-alanine ligase
VKVALLYNDRPQDQHDDARENFDCESTIAAVVKALRGLDAEVEPVPADFRLPWRLAEGRFDFAFNMAEGRGRRCREAVPAAVCEFLGLPFTGSDAVTLGLTHDKALAKRVVSRDVPVPKGILVETESDEAYLTQLRFPVIVKPNDEGSSKGIGENPVASEPSAAKERCRWLRKQYRCSVLVEEFLPGAEVTVGIAGNRPGARVLGMMEIAAAGSEPFVYSVEAKRNCKDQVRYFTPPRLEADTAKLFPKFAMTAYRLLGCRDIARMVFRLDARGAPHFIECNPLPGLNPVTGDIVLLSRPSLTYESLIQGILLDAMSRCRRDAV